MSSVSIPKHVAIIMDGNGRWAKSQDLPRLAGHKAGANTAKDIALAAADLGIKYLTLYTFSSENWLRPASEVAHLMSLLRYYLKQETKILHKNNIRINVIGSLERLDVDIYEQIQQVAKVTENNTGLQLTLAISYGAREEILYAAKALVQEVTAGKIALDTVTETMFSNLLYTKNIPDPDLIIRTSGEMRLSNFLIWQSAYSELYFSDVLWPDFTKEDLVEAIAEFNKRERRYGK